MMKIALLCGVLAAGAGCNSSGSSTGKDGGGGTDGAGMQATCTPDGKTVALTGKYGIQATLLVNVKVTPGCTGSSCIVNSDANAELLLLADVTQSGTSINVSAVPCKIVIPPVALKGGNKPVMLSTPKPLIDSVKAITSSGDLSGPQTCATFDAKPIAIALGANLSMPNTDPLPTFSGPTTKLCGGMASTACLTNTTPAPSDTGCVCDQDADGKLGATLDAMNAPGFDDIDKIYVDLRTSVTLKGQVFPGNQLRGKVANLALDQNVLGCHRNLTGGAQPRDCDDTETMTVAGFNPAVTQSANGDSTFVAVPLQTSDTCASLIANEATLFQ